ncbi:MAG: tetratricopeptide repeat protein [Hymenobacter sp.]
MAPKLSARLDRSPGVSGRPRGGPAPARPAAPGCGPRPARRPRRLRSRPAGRPAAALPPTEAATLLYRLGRCQAGLHQPAEAERSTSRALALDTTLAEAYLARGENRLLELRRIQPALADLRRGARQLARAGRTVPLPYVQAEGAALTHLARYPEARAVYLQALESQPEDGRTLFLLGRLAQQTGDSTSGCEFFGAGPKRGTTTR